MSLVFLPSIFHWTELYFTKIECQISKDETKITGALHNFSYDIHSRQNYIYSFPRSAVYNTSFTGDCQIGFTKYRNTS